MKYVAEHSGLPATFQGMMKILDTIFCEVSLLLYSKKILKYLECAKLIYFLLKNKNSK